MESEQQAAMEKPPKEHKKKTPTRPSSSITVPPNFPGSVTISRGETPYPEDQTVGGTVPGQTFAPTNPGWLYICVKRKSDL
jgi:hypothetical protein